MAPHRLIGKKTLGAAAMLAMGFGLVSPALAQDGGRDRQRQQDRRGDTTRDEDQDPRDRRIEQLEKRLAERDAAIKKLKQAMADQARGRSDRGDEDRDADGARAQQKRMEERLGELRRRLADGQFDDVRKRLEEALRDGNREDRGAIHDRAPREPKERNAQHGETRSTDERQSGQRDEPRASARRGGAARPPLDREGRVLEMRIRHARMLSRVFRRMGLERLADGAERRAEALRGALERRHEDGDRARPGARGRTEERGARERNDGPPARAPRAGNRRPGTAPRDGRDDHQDDRRDEPQGRRGERRLL